MIWLCDIQIRLFSHDHTIIIINHTIILPDPGHIIYRECRQLSRVQPIQTTATLFTQESLTVTVNQNVMEILTTMRSFLLKTRKLMK